jgi:hypothetical protein
VDRTETQCGTFARHDDQVAFQVHVGASERFVEFFDGMNTPLAEFYLPITEPNWQPNFVACYGQGDNIEVRCFGRFRVARRNQKAAAFFRYLRRVDGSLGVRRDDLGREYIRIGGAMPYRSRKDWERFWRVILRVVRSVASYKGRKRKTGIGD